MLSIKKDCKNIDMEEYTTTGNETYTMSWIEVLSGNKGDVWYAVTKIQGSTISIFMGVGWTYTRKGTSSLHKKVVASFKISALTNLFLASYRPFVSVSTYLSLASKRILLHVCVLLCRWLSGCCTKIVFGDHPNSVISLDSGCWEIEKRQQSQEQTKEATVTVYR